MNLKDELRRIAETVQRQRDEIRLQLHLARQDVKDEWDDLEDYWDRFRHRLDEIVRRNENETTPESRRTARQMGQELKEHYERLRERLK